MIIAEGSLTGQGTFVTKSIIGEYEGPPAWPEPIDLTVFHISGDAAGGQAYVANSNLGSAHASANDSPAGQVLVRDENHDEVANVVVPPNGTGPVHTNFESDPAYVWFGQPGVGFFGVFASEDQQSAQFVAGDGDGNTIVSYNFSPTDNLPASSSSSTSSSSDTITSGLGTDTVVAAGEAAAAAADAVTGAETVIGAPATTSSETFALSDVDSVSAAQVSDFVSQDALPAETLDTATAATDGGAAAEIVPIDDMTTVELKGIDKPF